MSKGIFCGVSNLAMKVKRLYVGIDNVSRRVKKVYAGIDGLARLVWSGKPEVKNNGHIILTYATTSMGQANVSNSEYAFVGLGQNDSKSGLGNGNTISKNLVIGTFSSSYGYIYSSGCVYSSPNKAYMLCSYSFTSSSDYKYLTMFKTDLTRSFVTFTYYKRYGKVAGTQDYVIFRSGEDKSGEVESSSAEILHRDTDVKTTRSIGYLSFGAAGEIGGYALFAGGEYNGASATNLVYCMNTSLTTTTIRLNLADRFTDKVGESATNERYCIFATGDAIDANLVRTNIITTTIPNGLATSNGLALWFEPSMVYTYDENLVKSTGVGIVMPTFRSVEYTASTVGDYSIITHSSGYGYNYANVLKIA